MTTRKKGQLLYHLGAIYGILDTEPLNEELKKAVGGIMEDINKLE